jgi:hypothetical protein
MDDSGRLKRGLLRQIAGLLNRCPHWVASPTLEQDCVLARSPTGAIYRIEVHTQQEAQHRLQQWPWETGRLILVLLSGNPQALAAPAGVHLWTLNELDYLVIAADLESNAPLAHLGLEVALPRTTLSASIPQHATQGY